jgi:hypothetical protein
MSYCDQRSVTQCFFGVESHLLDIYGLIYVRRPLRGEDGSVISITAGINLSVASMHIVFGYCMLLHDKTTHMYIQHSQGLCHSRFGTADYAISLVA